jgi:hypothetical protein
MYQALHDFRHASVWIYTILRGTYIEHSKLLKENTALVT